MDSVLSNLYGIATPCASFAKGKYPKWTVQYWTSSFVLNTDSTVWTKGIVREPNSLAMCKVQKVTGGNTSTYTEQHNIENIVQKECEVQFTLAHRVPIKKHLLANKLRFLSNKEVVKSMVKGTF